MTNKIIKTCYYYKTQDNEGQLIYKCLYENENKVVEQKHLIIKNCRNFTMSVDFNLEDEELFRFKDDLIKFNTELKSILFKNPKNQCFRIDIFNYNTITEAIYNTVIINSQQKIINEIETIDKIEFKMLENCISSALMTIDKTILKKPIECYGYDFSKFYYQMLKRIKIPNCKPEYKVIETIDYTKLDFGIYRVKILCENKQFWNVFNFNSSHHYNHNTLKNLYKVKDKYKIEFKLLEIDEIYNYNQVLYKSTIKLERVFKDYFKICDKLLENCSKNNWLMKQFVSRTWGILTKYNKIYHHSNVLENLDWYNLSKINSDIEIYEYYNYDSVGDTHSLIPSYNAYKYKGLGRIKTFLTEFSRNYIFKMLDELNVVENVMRCHTDGIVFNKPIDFTKLDYYPKPEDKSTGIIIFNNLNDYYHICNKCDCEYKFDKNIIHNCK